MSAPELRRDTGRRRFEAGLEGRVAGFLNYRESDGRIDLLHTEIAPEHQGQGLGEQLVRFALDEAGREGRQVVPSCSFVAAFIRRHPQYQGLVAS